MVTPPHRRTINLSNVTCALSSIYKASDVKEDTFFSIIIPVYNVERYLSFCIESILNQSFKNFEAIFVDDGSTDDSRHILDMVTDKRIIVIHKQNEGVSSARNVGLNLAKGKYVIFCDPDDSLLPNALQTFHESLDQYPSADWIRGNNIVSSPNGKKRKEGLHKRRAPYANKYLNQEEWWSHIVNAGEIWATCFNRSKIEAMNLRFNPLLRTGEDGIWLLDYTMEGHGVYIPNEVYDYLFQRADGLSFTRAKTPDDCVSIVRVVEEWKCRTNRYPQNCIMHQVCMSNYRARVRNGLGGLSFVAREIRMTYINQLKLICPKIEYNKKLSLREKVKTIMYNYLPILFILPNSK